jgi:hypothetical protein
MLRAARELLAVRSPLDAELMVSELLGTWWGQRSPRSQAGTDIEELIGEGLVAYAAGHETPAALALLSGIACLGTPRQAARAEKAGLALIERGIRRPGWAEQVGAVSPGDCYVNSDVFGDRDELVCLYSYAGTEPHALVLTIDYNVRGMLRDGWVTSRVDTVVERCRADSAADSPSATDSFSATDSAANSARGDEASKAGTSQGGTAQGTGAQDTGGQGTGGQGDRRGRFRQVRGSAARQLLESALAVTDGDQSLPSGKSFPAYHALIRARVRALPPADPPPAPIRIRYGGPAARLTELVPESGWDGAAARRQAWSGDRRAMLVVEFLASDEAEDLSDRQSASRCADHIINYGCDQDFGRPLRVSPAKAETFLLDWLPRKIMLTAPQQHAMPHVLVAWCRWAGKRRSLAPEATRQTLDAIYAAMGTFWQVYRDPTTFGLDPSLVARLLPDADLEALPRRTFAFPVMEGRYNGIDLATLDPTEAEARRTLLAADHNDANGRPTSGQHLSRHLVLSDLLWHGDPPELWEAAQRMLDRGEDRHAVQHTLMYVIRDAGGDPARLATELAKLP